MGNNSSLSMGDCSIKIPFGIPEGGLDVLRTRKSVLTFVIGIGDIKVYYAYVRVMKGSVKLKNISNFQDSCPVIRVSYSEIPNIFYKWIPKYIDITPPNLSVINRVGDFCGVSHVGGIVTSRISAISFYTNNISSSQVLNSSKSLISNSGVSLITHDFKLSDVSVGNVHPYRASTIRYSFEGVSSKETHSYKNANVDANNCFALVEEGTVYYDDTGYETIEKIVSSLM